MAKKKNREEKSKKEKDTSDKNKEDAKKRGKPFWKSKKFIGLAILLAVAGFALYQFRQLYLAALVNGTPITRFEVIRELEGQYGRQVLDNLVTKELILQEAREQGVQVDEEQIQSEVQEFQSLAEQQGSTLEEQLAAGGQTRAGLEENLRVRQLVEKLLGEDIEITEEELREFYEENQELYGDASFEDIQGQLREQMYQQRLSGKYSSWIEQLRQESRVIRFIDY